MESSEDLVNIVITGAASGIGSAVANRLRHRANTLWLLDNDQNALDVTRGQISREHVVAIRCDVSDENDCHEAFRRIGEEVERVDLLVLSAGITTEGFLESMTLHDWNLILNTNLTGAFLTIRSAIPLMKESLSPVIVAVGSISSNLIGAGGGNAAYEVSKAGLGQLVRAVAMEHANDGLRAVLVSPGRTTTNLGVNSRRLQTSTMTSRPLRVRPSKVKEIPLQRSASADEIASAVEYLASRDAAYITGSELIIDGGYGLY